VRLELRGIGMGPESAPALATLDVVLTQDGPVGVAAEGDRAPMLASLIAGGRLVPDRGEVLLDGRSDPARVRAAVALVDTPMAADPPDDLPVATVVREELLFARRGARRHDVDAVLDAFGLGAWRRSPIADLPPAARIALLTGLAARRPGVRALVLTSPERHGGDPAEWVRVVTDLTAAGTPVLVIGGAAVAQALPAPAVPAPAATLPLPGTEPGPLAPTGTDE
jgi:hypothetical protein